jgi:Tol biopolymer transport system component
VTADHDERSPERSSETALALGAGSRLGAYVLEARIGSGGMGDVFRALDTRLDRRVAIKICTTRFSERFEREAKALSALNHPNVCTLFDVGPDYLVMELIDGETLAARIDRGPLARADTARYGAQIADALAEAHRVGILHRDLKPQNVMLTRHGAKVLDFGIAKRTRDDALTQTGAVIGTAAYLAPEQLAGAAATERSDLYALGVVLHEMLTGQRPLPGTTAAKIATGSVATGVRRRPISALDTLVARLLEPDPARRPESAAVVADELRALAAPPRSAGTASRWIAAAAVGAIIVVGAAAWRELGTSGNSAALEVVRLTPATSLQGRKRDPAYSPDGKTLAFVWAGASGNDTGIYALREGENAPIRLTHGATDISPAWAPDGGRIAFLRVHSGRSNELMTVRIPERGAAAPAVEKLRDVQQFSNITELRRPMLAWAPDSAAIVVPLPDAESGLTSLFRVPLDGGAPRRVVASRGGQGDSAPAISRDGRWLAYADFEAQSSQLYTVPLTPEGVAAGERQPVPGGRGGLRTIAISPDGQSVLWTQGARLMEWRRGAAESEEIYVATDVFQSIGAAWNDPEEPRVVFANVGRSIGIDELTLLDGGRAAAGPSLPIVRFPTNTTSPALSPDGNWLAFQAVGKSGNQETWLANPRGENARAVLPLAEGIPILWSPDSRQISFHARVESVAQLFVVDIDENGVASSPRQVTKAPFSLFGAVWSRDGRYLYSTYVRAPTAPLVVRVPTAGGDLEDLFAGASARPSVDGKRIFYGKPPHSGLYERSLEGDVVSNPERLVLEDYAPNVGFLPTEQGIFYMGRDEQRQPAALRFFDFELQRSFDLGPPPQPLNPTLTVSPDGTRLLFEKSTPVVTELTLMELRRP